MRNDPQYIVIHHSQSQRETTAEEIQRWHLTRGWLTIGYHWVIENDALVNCGPLGRPEWMHGAHCRAMNRQSIGICITGDFREDHDTEPTDWQKMALARLLRLKLVQYEIPRMRIVLHRDYSDTDCPGTITKERVLEWLDQC